MLSEDIKIVKEIKDSYLEASKCGLGYPSDNREHREKAQAIENVLNRLQDLEQINKAHKDIVGELIKKIEYLEKNNNEFMNGEIFSAKQLKLIEESQKKYFINKQKIREIRDKAECLDYYCLNDVIDDLNKLLGEED